MQHQQKNLRIFHPSPLLSAHTKHMHTYNSNHDIVIAFEAMPHVQDSVQAPATASNQDLAKSIVIAEKPIAVPKKGALQGVAINVANIPDRNKPLLLFDDEISFNLLSNL